MSPLTDESDESRFADDDLNPLLNPLLAAHMGRWAEVYFTTPPERRVEAVTELIRELQAAEKVRNREEKDALETPLPLQPGKRIPITRAWASTNPDAPCAACGQLNPGGQRFCGSCGSPLHGLEPKVSEADRSASTVPSSSYGAGLSFYGDVSDAIDDMEQKAAPAEEPHNGFEFASAIGDNDLPSFAREVAPASHRHWLYVGALIAVVLATLVYFGHYRTEVFSWIQESPAVRAILAAAHSAGRAPEAPETKPAAIDNTEKNETVESAQNPTQSAFAAQPLPKAEPIQKQDQPGIAPSTRQTQSASPNTRTAEATSGREELAEAAKYLSGSSRDGGEAAQWLWKAVAKGNGPGTVELADLYLRGDGVAKNCDQGRLLLDLAAKKGIKGAAEQLRNLQAFGCQ
jgi:TPR repeat protein